MKINNFSRTTIAIALVLTLMSPILCNQQRNVVGDPELAKKIRRFSPTVLTANTSKLSINDRKALTKIIAAAKLLDPLFLRQVWSGNENLYQKLLKDKSPIGVQRLHYFLINDGPWSRLDEKEPFIESVPKEKPLNANYYPDDIKFNERAGTFSIDRSKIKEAVRKLTHEILTLQAEGSYEKAKAMLDKYGLIRPPMKAALDRLSNVPVDIEPIFPLAK